MITTQTTRAPIATGVHGTRVDQVGLGADHPVRDVLDERGRMQHRLGLGRRDYRDGTGRPHARVQAQLARARCETAADRDRLTWRHLLDKEVAEALAERDPARLRVELVQVAAVVLSWIEDLDHRADAALAELIQAATNTTNTVDTFHTVQADQACPAVPVARAGVSMPAAVVAGRRVQ